MDGDLGGLAVHIAARVMASARSQRGARLEHREGPRGGLWNRLRGPRRARAAGRPRRVATVRGRLKRTATLQPIEALMTPSCAEPSRSSCPRCSRLACRRRPTPPTRHVVRGAGFGHGIGMSQYGAYGYALEGSGYEAILAHYYQGTRMTQRLPAARCACCCSRTTPTSACAAPRASAARALQPGERPTWRAGPARRRVVSRPAASGSGASPARRVQRARDRSLRLLGPALNGVTSGRYRGEIEVLPDGGGRDRDQRARHRLLRARRGGRRDAVLLAARGAQGAGGGRAHLRARHPQDDRRVRPVPGHPLAGLPRRDRRERRSTPPCGPPPAGSSPTAATPP